MSRTRLLYFAPRVCLPPDTGAKLRNYYLMKQVSRWARITHLGFVENESSRIRTTSEFCEELVAVPLDRRNAPAKLIRGALGQTPLPVLNYTTQRMKSALARLLRRQKFDIVQIEGVHLAGYVDLIRSAAPDAFLICDWHNIESDLLQRYRATAASRARRLYAGLTVGRMRNAERRVARLLDGHFAVSASDAARIRKLAGDACVRIVPNGVDVERFTNVRTGKERRSRIVFVGSMDYHANIDAVKWFVRDVWPEVLRKRPDLRFTIIGRRPAGEVRSLERTTGVEVTGTVDDVADYYRSALAAVAPLRVGGGSRLKILEAMAAGVPVVSTGLGAEGLETSNGRNIILGDSASEMAEALLDLGENAVKQRWIAAAGLRFVRGGYDWSAIGRVAVAAYEELLEGRPNMKLAGDWPDERVEAFAAV